MNPYVFIVGCPRSGTTLLKRVVDAHPEITITRETHWITKLLEGDDAASVGAPVTRALLDRLLADERYQRLRLDPAPLERLVAGDRPVSYAELVTTVYDQHGAKKGKPFVGDKTPRYVRHIAVLHELFPHARFVHLIRDGRDVCLSVLDWKRRHESFTKFATWEEDRVSTAALWWEARVRAGREAGTPLAPGLYRETIYDAFVADPEAACRELCDFLDVRYSERMISFHEGHERDDASLSAKRAWRPITPGLRSWRTEMSARDLERFEAAAGALLDELGYARAVPDPSPAAREHAARMREAFSPGVAARR